MNILIEQLPESVEINGAEYRINTDFRTCLSIILAFEDEELTQSEKISVMLELLYIDVPSDVQKACDMALLFLDCGESRNAEKGGAPCERLYSFEHDARYIFSAIKQTHGVDLDVVDQLHWWKFCYMFMDLSENCFFSRILYYRKQKSRGKLSKEEREYCASIRDIIDLPQKKSLEEQEAESMFFSLLKK